MWKTITYMDTKIEVSTDGQIKWNGEIRTPYLNKDGYPVVSIKTPKGWRSPAVHRLMAVAYIPNPNNLPEVNHKDYIRTNYNLDNLEWSTRRDNVIYSAKAGHYSHFGEDNPNYGNHILSEKYANDPELAKEKQSRPGSQNGRYIDGRRMKV